MGAATQATTCEDGRIILDGSELRTDADVVTCLNRYSDERGAVSTAFFLH